MLNFQAVKRIKPGASRSESREFYFLCTNYGNSENANAKKAKELGKRFEKVHSAGGFDTNSSFQARQRISTKYKISIFKAK